MEENTKLENEETIGKIQEDLAKTKKESEMHFKWYIEESHKRQVYERELQLAKIIIKTLAERLETSNDKTTL